MKRPTLRGVMLTIAGVAWWLFMFWCYSIIVPGAVLLFTQGHH